MDIPKLGLASTCRSSMLTKVDSWYSFFHGIASVNLPEVSKNMDRNCTITWKSTFKIQYYTKQMT